MRAPRSATKHARDSITDFVQRVGSEAIIIVTHVQGVVSSHFHNFLKAEADIHIFWCGLTCTLEIIIVQTM